MLPYCEQERATAVSHSATSKHARELGDPVLADICMAIANDERRHELAYTRIVDELWNLCAARSVPEPDPVRTQNQNIRITPGQSQLPSLLGRLCCLTCAGLDLLAAHDVIYAAHSGMLCVSCTRLSLRSRPGRRDPSGTMIAFYDMMKKTIVMPAHLMDDGKHVRHASEPIANVPSCFVCPPVVACVAYLLCASGAAQLAQHVSGLMCPVLPSRNCL